MGIKYILILSNFLLFASRSNTDAFAPHSASMRPGVDQSNIVSASRLYAVADPPLPAEHHDKDKKKSKNEHGSISNNGDWTPTKGGFFANITERKTDKSRIVQEVDNIEDYKNVVVDEKEQIVVVRFFAP